MTDIMAFHQAVGGLLKDVTERAIMPYYQQLAAHEVQDKGGNDPVTVADRASEAMLIEGLEKIVPGLPVVGEEGSHADPSIMEHLSGDCWIVDPIDGTRNFAHGRPPFGILLAMASGGEAHTGWIYDCLTGRLCIAHKSRGAFINGEKINARLTGEDLPVAAVSLIFMDKGKREAVRRHILPHYRVVDVPYCAAEQYPRLVLGTNDVSLFERTLPWDHAAGALFVNEAGGRVARPDGSAYRVDEWQKPGLIGAASPQLWDGLAGQLATLPE